MALQRSFEFLRAAARPPDKDITHFNSDKEHAYLAASLDERIVSAVAVSAAVLVVAVIALLMASIGP